MRICLIWHILEAELGVLIYPGGCPGTDVHLVSVRFQQVVEEHGRLARHAPRPASGPQPCAVRPPSPLNSAPTQPGSVLVCEARKAALEQEPSSPRALATALGSPHSNKNAPKSNRPVMLAVRCCNFAGAAQSARLSPCLSLYPFSPPPHLNNRPLIGPPIPCSSLHLSLPSLHPNSCPLDTPAPQCSHAPLPRPPPSPLAVVVWCLLNSATSTTILVAFSQPPAGAV